MPVIKQEIEGKKIDTVSFSHTMLDVHLPNIIRAGHRVAICDQLEDPKLVKVFQRVKLFLTELTPQQNCSEAGGYKI